MVEERGTPAGLRQAPQETRRREVGLRQGEIKSYVMGSPKPPLFIGEGEEGAPPLGFPPLGGRQP